MKKKRDKRGKEKVRRVKTSAVTEVRRETFPGGDVMIYKSDGSVVRHESEAHKRDRRHFEGPQFDVFARGHKVPKSVCILGPGINAVKDNAYKLITADEIIAVNYAVLISKFFNEKPLESGKTAEETNLWPAGKKIDSWCVCEFDVDAVPWFKKMFKVLEVRRYFSTNTCVGVVDIPTPWNDDQLYTYQVAKRPMRSRIYDPAEGLFHPDTTAIGVAACLAVELGAERLELCGCDLFGNTYYDSTTRGQPQFNNAPIPNADRLDSCLQYLVDHRGIEIVTLSRTTLKTPKPGQAFIDDDIDNIDIDDDLGMRDGFNAMQV